MPLVIAGMTGGAIVSGILAAVGGGLPAFLVPRAPEMLGAALHGDNVALVLLMVVTGGVAGFLGGKARPPAAAAEGGEPQGASGVSFFRFAVAAGLMGLITGVATSLLQGGFDLFVTLDWILALTVAGILSAAIARLLTRN
jgi:hypothetical protein